MRLRAERRCGELFREMQRADKPNPDGIGGKSRKIVTRPNGGNQSEYASALAATGIHERTALIALEHEAGQLRVGGHQVRKRWKLIELDDINQEVFVAGCSIRFRVRILHFKLEVLAHHGRR